MGMLVNGNWEVDPEFPTDQKGKFDRPESVFRRNIIADGSTADNIQHFKAEPDRYHLYVSFACPWAHRTLIMRKLKNLGDVISFSSVNALMGENGWQFNPKDDETKDPLYNKTFLHEIYTQAKPDYTGKVTVPVLWDKKTKTIVNNESAEIIRMLNSEFNEFSMEHYDYYPETLRQQIDETNDFVYDKVNNGVYKCGFAKTQEAYDEAFDALFSALDDLEQRLSKQRYLIGHQLTEADWRLFTTLLRFDPVYYSHFKCNLRRIMDYPSLWGYLRDLYQHPGIAETVRMDHIKNHYYQSHLHINPTGIVPKGPFINLATPHNREHLF